MADRRIIHLDMDAFYASVERFDDPSLRGKPVIVGGSSNRGVVSAASYEARKYGVHSALPIVAARKLCPNGIFLPVRMARYKEISDQIMAIFHRYTPLVEPISLDEAFLDITASTMLLGSAEKIGLQIKKVVWEETGLTISAGVASSKLLAKIASEIDKPDGFTVVPHGEERHFLAPLPIKRLWGIGSATRKTLTLMGIQTIGDLSKVPPSLLTSKFGKLGIQMHYAALGIDERQVTPERQVQSIGNEETFEKDLTALKTIQQEILALCNKVGKRLRSHNLAAKTVTLKLKYNDFKQITRSITIKEPTNDNKEIYQQSCKLLNNTEAGRKPVRLLGISLANLCTSGSAKQLPLFSKKTTPQKRHALHKAMDTISEKFGGNAIRPGTLIDKNSK